MRPSHAAVGDPLVYGRDGAVIGRGDAGSVAVRDYARRWADRQVIRAALVAKAARPPRPVRKPQRIIVAIRPSSASAALETPRKGALVIRRRRT